MCADYVQRFRDAIDDDLDTPTALVALGELDKEDGLPPGSKFETFAWADRVLGLDLVRDVGRPRQQQPLPAGAQELLDQRAGARAARDWAGADALRDQLAAIGVTVADTAEGQVATVQGSER
jgi:cysteinyl-tRNA synthetase